VIEAAEKICTFVKFHCIITSPLFYCGQKGDRITCRVLTVVIGTVRFIVNRKTIRGILIGIVAQDCHFRFTDSGAVALTTCSIRVGVCSLALAILYWRAPQHHAFKPRKSVILEMFYSVQHDRKMSRAQLDSDLRTYAGPAHSAGKRGPDLRFICVLELVNFYSLNLTV
jgi:hypothetical protein